MCRMSSKIIWVFVCLLSFVGFTLSLKLLIIENKPKPITFSQEQLSAYELMLSTGTEIDISSHFYIYKQIWDKDGMKKIKYIISDTPK